MSAEVFIRKLEAFASLDEDDHILLRSLLSKRVNVRPQQPFVREGDAVGIVHILLTGMACRYKDVGGGKRQISAFILPGDFCDSHLLILKKADHSIAALDDCTVAEVSKEQLLEMLDRPKIAKSFLFSKLVEESILREWVSNIGQRNAVQRMAHLFYEIYLRMQAVGVASESSVSLPLSQTDLGDALGLSLVHTNKSLRVLRDLKLVEFKRGKLTLFNIDALAETCRFSSAYLHLEGGKIHNPERRNLPHTWSCPV